MVERQIILPASRRDVWAALTEPAQVAAWFGAQVEWDLRPGGRAAFSGHDGGTGDRAGIIAAVSPERSLRFRWWPAGSDHDRYEPMPDEPMPDEPMPDEPMPDEQGAAPRSEVTYTLEDDPAGTRLVVTEEPLASTVATTSLALQWEDRALGLWLHTRASHLVCA